MYNQVVLIGRLGNVKINQFKERAAINCSVATTDYKKEADGNFTTNTEWHNVEFFAFKGQEDKFFKGRLVLVVGKIVTKKYEKDGVTKTMHTIRADKMQVLDRAEKNPNEYKGVITPIPENESGDLPF